MAEVSYPFDGGTGSLITEQQWSNMSATWQDNGVIAVGPSSMSLKVTTLNQVGVVYVEAGEANLLGFHYENTAQLPVAVPANNTALTRIDIVALQLDKNTNAVRVVYKTGTAASSPVPPGLVTTGGVYEIALAQIQMGPNATQVPNTQPQLVDKRSFIGKRIQPSEDVLSAPEGAIVYKPSDGKFYAKNSSSTIQLGAPPDLSGYSLTTHNHAGVYSPTAHNHDGVYSPVGHTHSGGGAFTPASARKEVGSAQNITALSTTPVQILFPTTSWNVGMDVASANVIRVPNAGGIFEAKGYVMLSSNAKATIRVGLQSFDYTYMIEIGDDTMATMPFAFSISHVFQSAGLTATAMWIESLNGTPTVSITNGRMSVHRIG